MNFATIVRRTLITAAAVAGLAVAPLSSANPVLIATGFANGSENFSVATPVLTNQPTGGFVGTLDSGSGPSTLFFFCFELTEHFQFGPNPLAPSYTDTVFTGLQATLLSELYSEGYQHAFDSASNSAAFQLAVWEILEETPTPGSLLTGNFKVTSADTTTVDNASALIAGLTSSAFYEIHLLHSAGVDGQPGSQDFIYGIPSTKTITVPEPSSLLLMAIALAGMGFAMRRKSSNLA